MEAENDEKKRQNVKTVFGFLSAAYMYECANYIYECDAGGREDAADARPPVRSHYKLVSTWAQISSSTSRRIWCRKARCPYSLWTYCSIATSRFISTKY